MVGRVRTMVEVDGEFDGDAGDVGGGARHVR